MKPTVLLPLFLPLISGYITINPLQIELHSGKYNLNFTQTNSEGYPDGPSKQPDQCNLSWLSFTQPATCYKSCEGGTRARITPGTFKGLDDFSLDVWQDYHGIGSWLDVHGTARVSTKDLLAGYTCKGNVCEVKKGGRGFRTEEGVVGRDEGPMPDIPICM
ncbi:hypothetical protein K470DRAFT_271636 [Piedraia hortae CBS 480.64]|uniref:Uncharacterized protein n=1 Tax=Piedraia hortae CBS 480.64 TaxID=1314780 RepID=A0A6A7BX80_9PEZI|nr:hypothetical protein K470DRAFT_271636 [Piedraia hortae CBS 480.64]